MSGEPTAVLQPPPTPTPRGAAAAAAAAAAGTVRPPAMPPLSPRGTQRRTPASVLASAPVNTPATPPRKVAPVIISAASSLISPSPSAEEHGAEAGDRSPMPRRPTKEATKSSPATTPTKKAATTVKSTAPPSEAVATAAKTDTPITPSTASEATKKRSPSSDLVNELRRLSDRHRSHSGESDPSPSPGATAPAPQPKPLVSNTAKVSTACTPMPTTPRARTAAPAPDASPSSSATAVPVAIPNKAGETTPLKKSSVPAPAGASPKAPMGGSALTTPRGATTATAATTSTPKRVTPSTVTKASDVPCTTATTTDDTPVKPVSAVDRRVSIQLKLEETSEERRRARLVYDELQEYVQLRKDFREEALAMLAEGKSAEAARERFLRREAAKGLAPVDLSQMLEALGPAPTGTSRATTPRAGTTGARGGSSVALTPLRGTSPSTPVRPAVASVPLPRPAVESHATTPLVKPQPPSPLASVLTTDSTTPAPAATATATMPTPRTPASRPPLTPRVGATPASAVHTPPPTAIAATPRERSVMSLPTTPRTGSLAPGASAADLADAREREREVKELRRDKEKFERELERANAKLAELQEKFTAEKEAHNADRKDATAKLNAATNEGKQFQKELRDAQRSAEKLQKELDKAAEVAEKWKQQVQTLKEKAPQSSVAASAGLMPPLTPRSASVSSATVAGANTSSNNAAELRALERKVESLEKDKKRLEESLEKMTQRQSDASAELRTTKQDLQKSTSEAAKEKAALQSELKQRGRDVEKLERSLQQKMDEIEKLKEKASASAGTASGAMTPRRAGSLAVPTTPSAKSTTGHDGGEGDRVNALETELRQCQRELRQASDRVKTLEAERAAEAEANTVWQNEKASLSAKEQSLRNTVRELEKAIQSTEKDRDATRTAQQKAEDTVKSLQTRIEELKKAHDGPTQARLAAQDKALVDLQQKLTATEKERDALHGVAQDTADEAAKLADELEVKEKALQRLQDEHVKQREVSLVEAESQVKVWQAKHDALQTKVRELEEAVCELQSHAEQVEQEAKTLQTALEAAEQAREELANRYASQSKRFLLQQQQQQKKNSSSTSPSPTRQQAQLQQQQTSYVELESSLAEVRAALAAKSEEAATLARELAALQATTKTGDEKDLTDSLIARMKAAEAALKAARCENTEIKAVNDKVFVHLSKLEGEVEAVRASSASQGRLSTSSSCAQAGADGAVLSQHTRELIQTQLEKEKASRRQLEQDVRRLQAKLRRLEKGEAVSTTVSPNVSAILPAHTEEESGRALVVQTSNAAAAAGASSRTTTPVRGQRRKSIPTAEMAQQWNRGYFTPLASLSPAKEEDVFKNGTSTAPAQVPVTTTADSVSAEAPRSATWRPSQAFEEEEAELLRQQFEHDSCSQPDRTSPASCATGNSFTSGAPFPPPRARRPSRARSPQAAHCLDTRFFDPTNMTSAEDGVTPISPCGAPLHLPAPPQQTIALAPTAYRGALFGGGEGAMSPSTSMTPVSIPGRYATRLSPQNLTFASTAQRLLVSGRGRRVERLLLQPTMSGSTSPHKAQDSASIVSTSAVGSLSHSLYATRMEAEGQHWERNVFAYTVRVGDLRDLPQGPASAAKEPLDVLVGFSDRYVPLEGFGNGRNSLRYSGCYYLHLGSGTLYAPAQGARRAPYPGWSAAATQARAVCSPPSPSLLAPTTGVAIGGRNVHGVALAAQSGDEITCVLHVRERCIRFEWNGVDCGVAFENVSMNPSLYPSVEMNSSGGCLELL